MYCVYLHRNKINNKVYIGQTKHGGNPNKRWNYGQGYINNQKFYSDICTYGWDNFSHIILADNLSVEEANELEKKYIKQYNATNPQYGYNLDLGGGNYDKKVTSDRDRYYDFLIPETSKTLTFQTVWYNDANGLLRHKTVLI